MGEHDRVNLMRFGARIRDGSSANPFVLLGRKRDSINFSASFHSKPAELISLTLKTNEFHGSFVFEIHAPFQKEFRGKKKVFKWNR